MWGLWFFPLVKLSFWVGLAGAILWYLLRALAGKRPEVPIAVAVAVAAPVGCAALPGIVLALLAAIAPLFQKSDTQLYEDIFGLTDSFEMFHGSVQTSEGQRHRAVRHGIEIES
jgi:hypothetical protein